MKRPTFAIAETDGTAAIVVAAALTALAMFAIGAGLLIACARLRIENAGQLVTIAVVADDPEQQAGRARTIATMLRGRGDLRDVRIVPDAIVRSEIGDGALPALIDAKLLPGADETPLVRALAGLPGVNVARAETPATGGLRSLAHIAGLIAALACTGIIAGGIAAARERSARQAMTIALLERLGATDAQLLRLILFKTLRSLLIGCLAGAALAVPFLLWQASAAGLGGGKAFSLQNGTMLALTPIATILLGGLGATAAAWRGLRGRP